MTRVKNVLIGPDNTNHRLYSFLSVVLIFAATAILYAAIGRSTGVLPAVVIGSLASLSIGYFRAGISFAWAGMYASMMGYTAADVAATSIPVTELLVTLIGPEALGTAGVESVLIGSIVFAVGYGVSWGIGSVRAPASASDSR